MASRSGSSALGRCAAAQLGIRTIFASGDLALTKEAQALVPGIETVAVKRGTTPGAAMSATRRPMPNAISVRSISSPSARER